MALQFHFGYVSKENENTYSKKHMHLYVHCTIIYNLRRGSNLRCPPMDKRKGKVWYTDEYFSSIKKRRKICLLQ